MAVHAGMKNLEWIRIHQEPSSDHHEYQIIMVLVAPSINQEEIQF
jgi:hypothetical protein